MTSKNKFNFDPIDPKAASQRKSRSPGPMVAAVREAAENLQESTEAKIEQRRRNAEDAKSFRSAKSDGLVLERIPLSDVQTDDLPRDRLDLARVATSDEMDELKSSIRSRGQKEPIEVYRDDRGGLQLKKGWRRLTALGQLFEETGEAQFSTVMARIEQGEHDRLSRYIDMVEENVVREDLSFAEMALVVSRAMHDPNIEETSSDALIQRLYGSLHKMKRSYIRSFVYLQMIYGGTLKWPKAISRNLGVDVVREIKAGADTDYLDRELGKVESADAQNAVLTEFVRRAKVQHIPTDEFETVEAPKPKGPAKEKFEFHVDGLKVTARQGECRIVGEADFASLPREQLEKAVRAFREALA